MKEFTYTIKEPVGIHARPAGMLAKEAKTCQSTVTIVDKNGKSVDATRLMALMGMGIKCGDTVTVKIEGADEETAAPAMEKFFDTVRIHDLLLQHTGKDILLLVLSTL